MSKLSKLATRPDLFVLDAFKRRSNSAPKPKPKPKQTAKRPVSSTGGSSTPSGALAAKSEGQLSLLRSLVLDGEYEAVKRSWNLMKSGASPAEARSFLGVKAEAEFAQGDHDAVMATTDRMIAQYDSKVGYYLKAQSLFVRGRLDEALQELQILLHVLPDHADGTYLLCDILERTERLDQAWIALEALARTSKRNKTWHVMANLVRNDVDMLRLLRAWHEWRGKVGPAYHQDVSEFIALGALRADNEQLARLLWRESLMTAVKRKGGFAKMKKREPSYSGRRAEVALADTGRVFAEAGIEMFLVSGTLLGCVRENALLGHDKDIDVGIWSDVPNERVLELAQNSGVFLMLKSRSPDIIRLRHVNGIAIDVFYHTRDKDDYHHRGIKMVWHNTPFELVEREFLGATHLIPDDYDLYLTENYGDWRTPMIAFDSAYDTPNGEILSEAEMAVHSFKGLMGSCITSNWPKVAFYLDRLQEQDEEFFVEEFKQALVVAHGLEPSQLEENVDQADGSGALEASDPSAPAEQEVA